MISLKEIKNSMSNKITIPTAFDEFYNWCLVTHTKNPNHAFFFDFKWDINKDLLLGVLGKKHDDKFGVFASTPDGSIYAFWIDEQEQQKIIYISSDGGNVFVLGNTFMEFLQYLSIGYSSPDSADFTLTYKQIAERDKVDYNTISADNINAYHQNYGKPLQTEEGIKALFDENIDDKTLEMMLEINKNAALSLPETDANTVEKTKKEMKELDQIMNEQQNNFRLWLTTHFKVHLPQKGMDVLNVNDTSFENWVHQVIN